MSQDGKNEEPEDDNATGWPLTEFQALVELYANTGHDMNDPAKRRFIWHEPSATARWTEQVGEYDGQLFTALFDPGMDALPEELDELARAAAEMSGC